MAAREVDAQIEIERRVRKRYLGSSETKLRDAVFEALRRLYSLPRMPTNPYFFVATALSAHSAHGQRRSVWAVPDEEVLEGREEVALVDGRSGASSIDSPTRGVCRTCCDAATERA